MSRNTFSGERAILQIESELATHGVKRTTDAHGRPRYEVVCGYDGKEAGVFNSKVQYAEQVLSHFRKQGWQFQYKGDPYCSNQCMRLAKRRDKEERRIKEMKQADSAPPPAPITPPPSIGGSPRITRQVATLLNENFDVVKCLYAPGWSDERVAKEAGTSVQFVIAYREDAGYGKLAEDPEKTKMREDFKALEELQAQYHADITRKLEELMARLDRYTGVHHKAQG